MQTEVLHPSPVSTDGIYAELREIQANHPIWNNPLLLACREGQLTIEDFQFIFGQYYAYSRSFTRFLAALMAGCDDDLLRAQLSQNLWEEGGGASLDRRHSNIFREFLTRGLGLALEQIRFEVASMQFVNDYLDCASNRDFAYASAFLSMGTEGIVSRLYTDFILGLRQAGVAEEHLEFFKIHIACDDEHAETLEKMMLSAVGQHDFTCSARLGLEQALNLRHNFLLSLYRRLHERRPSLS